MLQEPYDAHQSIKPVVLSEISLLTTADQLIKMVEKSLEQAMKLQFDSRQRLQILRFKGIDSFVYGET
jgi:hypothetical protein